MSRRVNGVPVWCTCGRMHYMSREAAPYREDMRQRVMCAECRDAARMPAVETHGRPNGDDMRHRAVVAHLDGRRLAR